MPLECQLLFLVKLQRAEENMPVLKHLQSTLTHFVRNGFQELLETGLITCVAVRNHLQMRGSLFFSLKMETP